MKKLSLVGFTGLASKIQALANKKYFHWWGLINQVLLAYKEDIEEKLQRRIYEE